MAKVTGEFKKHLQMNADYMKFWKEHDYDEFNVSKLSSIIEKLPKFESYSYAVGVDNILIEKHTSFSLSETDEFKADSIDSFLSEIKKQLLDCLIRDKIDPKSVVSIEQEYRDYALVTILRKETDDEYKSRQKYLKYYYGLPALREIIISEYFKYIKTTKKAELEKQIRDLEIQIQTLKDLPTDEDFE